MNSCVIRSRCDEKWVYHFQVINAVLYQSRSGLAAGGWLHTGDQGFLDQQGYLTLTGRLKELINRGGEKISPIEVGPQVAGLLHAHPAASHLGAVLCYAMLCCKDCCWVQHSLVKADLRWPL